MDSTQEINANNFYQHHWTKGRRSIKLHQCLVPIISKTFETIQNLCFSHDILFENISTMLKNTPNLRLLSFQNPVLNDYKHLTSIEEPVNLPQLRTLWFHNTRPLGTNEYWLLDFFTRGVKMTNLNSFHFRTEKEPTENFSCLEKTVNEIGEKYGPEIETGIIGKFLAANGSVLADVSVGGEGFKLEGLRKEDTERLKQLKLTHLLCSIDTEGIGEILEGQRTLKSLTFKGMDAEDTNNWKLMPKIEKCVLKNSKTLKDFSLYFYPECGSSSACPDFDYNGEVFRKCQRLQRLTLAIVVSAEEGEKVSPDFKRIHALPRTLVEISITCQDLDPKEFDLLGNFIHEFKYLQRLYLCSLSATKYSLKLDWIKGFKCLGNFHEAEFVNVVKCDKEQIRIMESLLVPEFQMSPKIELIEKVHCLQFIRKFV